MLQDVKENCVTLVCFTCRDAAVATGAWRWDGDTFSMPGGAWVCSGCDNDTDQCVMLEPQG